MNKKGIIKSTKLRRFAKKLIYILGVASVALGMVGCVGGGSSSITPNPAPTPTPIVEVESVADLVKGYQSQTSKFLSETMLENMVEYSINEDFDSSKLVDATFDLVDGKNLTTVKLAFTYKQDDNMRDFYVNEATFVNAISPTDVANYSQNKDKLVPMTANANIKNDYSFEYNAYEQYENKDFVETLYKKASSSDTVQNRFMYAQPQLVENENFGGQAYRYVFASVENDGI